MNPAKNDKILQEGFHTARSITKYHAKTFYFASRFLDKKKRYGAYCVYAICRISDDTVDDLQSPSIASNLSNIKEKIESAYSDVSLNDPLLLAFRKTITGYQIPKKYFDELIEGMYMDLNKNRYNDFGEVHTYCYRVAGVVGLVMLKIFGYKDDEAEKYAVDLGIAMQLTNILRDIKEDHDRGRIYLPLDEMKRFNVTENDIASGLINDNLIKLLQFQIKRARDYYKSSSEGIKMITNKSSRMVVCMMKDMYSAILNAIENNSYDVFGKRAHTTRMDKIKIAFNVLLKGEYR